MPSNISRYTYDPGQNITGVASSDVTGQRFLLIGTSGVKPNPNVKPCTAGAKPFAVAGYDAKVGEIVPLLKGGVALVRTAANLTAGDEVESDAQGRAIVLATGKAAGRVLYDAASGSLAEIDLYL